MYKSIHAAVQHSDSLLPPCCLLTGMVLVAWLHLVSWRCFLGVSAAIFTTIFTVVLTYVISTAAMSGPATYSMLLAPRPRGPTPVSPPHQHVRDRLRTLGL